MPTYEILKELREKHNLTQEELAERVLGYLCGVEYDYPEFHLSMRCFRCRIDEGEPKLLEHEAARWLGREEMYGVDWLPADLEILPEIEKNWPAAD